MKVYRRRVSTYRISQLAVRSGVPASTLRFYDGAGLLPAERSDAGYRLYGEAALERLEFIASAKLLGLPLEEIGELLRVWEQGVCAAVRARLLPLVSERLADADRRITELSAFTAHLAAVHRELSNPAPDGGCGPGCGCLTSAPTGPVQVELMPTRPDLRVSSEDARLEVPVACSLTGPERGCRAGEWSELLASATAREQIAGGVRVTCPADPTLTVAVARLAAAELECCPFFDFTVHLTPASLMLEVRAPEAAEALTTDLFGPRA